MIALTFSPIEEIIADIAAGKIIICADDPTRENEADLICASSKVTKEIVAFMATHGRGLICAPISEEQAERLELPQMNRRNTEALKTAFTVSVDAAEGITTGISAADRAIALQILANPSSTPEMLVKPGHVFPLQAVKGGVLRRTGHTEAAVDLARLAGLEPAGIICEIMNEDGEMARVGDLGEYQKKHGLKACTIAQLVEHRRKAEKLINATEIIQLPTNFGEFDCHLYESDLDDSHHLALVRGEIDPEKSVLVRVHSECLTGDVFMSRRCDCGGQLHQALEHISEDGGVLLYLRQEGRGIGLPAKIHAYKLQEQGYDTVEANEKLGYGADLRDYGIGAQILYDLGVRKIRLLTNNPKKMVGLQGYSLEIVEQLPIKQCSNEHNEKYLQTKKERMNHLL